MTLTFRLLGPLEIRRENRPVRLSGVKPRVLLAYLLVNANRTVPIEEIVEELWGGMPPPSATANVRTYVAGLRRSMHAWPATVQVIAKPGAYQLALTGDGYYLDLDDFRAQARLGRAKMNDGTPLAAVDHFERALAMWRGPVLENLRDGSALSTFASHLEEDRAQVTADLIECRLMLGRPAEVIPVLRRSIQEEPLRERAYAQLMRALYQSGDSSEALEVFRSARTALTNDLGIEPGPQLTGLHRAILTGEPVGPAPWIRSAPCLTPPAAAGFVGRSVELTRGARILTSAEEGTLPILAISGLAGAGKTALATTLAHRVRDQYPGGQLYADLQGDQLEPADPAEIAYRFLRSLGVPPRCVPDGRDERSGMLRSELAGRRVLVLLDNAADEAQVRALLPGTDDCAALVTSRRRLAGLDGAQFVGLGCLAEPEAIAMFANVLGRQPDEEERTVASEIVRLCGLLPLAVRVAAARAADRPLEELAALLRDESRRLDELRVADLDVRARFAATFRALRPADRQLLRLMSGTADFTAADATAATGTDHAEVAASLENLGAGHLLTKTVPADGGPARYSFHALIRIAAI
ncbi:BTAD domain-containing putative transcriptional regulator [Actinoplanes sp. NPDC051861]|uniref:AfsR/SARP family transcriptional regulator n=1 Tax=Actinoplanes sp. NPDC051861 TaxID=3155170 RepID=UPI0034484131